ncbi:MAG: metal-dependent hydrolase [Nitrospira sp. CR1.3]|nr:metal-dependent hydrolase [Nitrospira sp. CR1.3]
MKYRIAAALAVWGIGAIPAFAGQQTTLTWHGHAAFEITTPAGHIVLIDPWLNNPLNPLVKDKQDPIEHIAKADYILLTHGHFDHVGDAVAIAKKTGAKLVANFELGTNLVKLQGFPKEQIGFDGLMNPGGEIAIANGEVMVAMTAAVHSSGMGNPMANEQSPDLIYGGNPGGYVLRIKGGPTIYHSGDTAYFKDMEIIGEQYAPDVALLNIGGHFGMEPAMAARAAASVKAKLAIAHHFGTFPVLTQDTVGFAEALKKRKIGFLKMTPGSTIVFDGKQVKAGSR